MKSMAFPTSKGNAREMVLPKALCGQQLDAGDERRLVMLAYGSYYLGIFILVMTKLVFRSASPTTDQTQLILAIDGR